MRALRHSAWISCMIAWGLAGVAAQAPRVAPARDACELISKTDIQAIQGQQVTETKSSRQKSGSLLISQCFYKVATAANSVSLSLALPDGMDSSSFGPKEYWEQTFHIKRRTEATKDEKEEAGEPRAIEGLGEEAFWVRNRFGGSLYVRKGNAFIIIGLGGNQDEPTRIRKAKSLARHALGSLG